MNIELPGLVWVLVDGTPRHVSDFARLRPRSRPAARCPQCDRRLTLKLGMVLRHHAAHQPGEICAATRPETALHINCKLALATTLRSAAGPAAELSIVQRCAGAGGETCDERLASVWTRAWDAVSVEQRVSERDSRRPDVVLHRAGASIAAIEIVVSNAVSSEKARALEALGMPWIEVPATEALASRNGWTVRELLEVLRASDNPTWRCDTHAALHHIQLAAVEARRAAERESERNTSVLRAARVVDVYHDGGAHERFIYRVTELLTDGNLCATRLQRGGAEVVTIPVDSVSDVRRRAWPLLRTALAADLERFSRGPGSFTDSPMRWARGDAAENIVGEALTDYVGRDPTPLATRYPRRWFYAPAQQRWFLPADMRDVRWDREPLDPFAAHPAWSQRRGAIRERPAPEGSWSTPVFASPPLAAMFRECVLSVERAVNDSIGIVAVGLADDTAANHRRVIVVVERAVSAAEIESVAARLDAEAIRAVWLSHPLHWSPALESRVWAPAGRDWRGRGGVVIDGLGIFKADQFARAWAKGDRGLSEETVRSHMAARVQRLSAKR